MLKVQQAARFFQHKKKDNAAYHTVFGNAILYTSLVLLEE